MTIPKDYKDHYKKVVEEAQRKKQLELEEFKRQMKKVTMKQ
jgi:hypothetical protein